MPLTMTAGCGTLAAVAKQLSSGRQLPVHPAHRYKSHKRTYSVAFIILSAFGKINRKIDAVDLAPNLYGATLAGGLIMPRYSGKGHIKTHRR